MYEEHKAELRKAFLLAKLRTEPYKTETATFELPPDRHSIRELVSDFLDSKIPPDAVLYAGDNGEICVMYTEECEKSQEEFEAEHLFTFLPLAARILGRSLPLQEAYDLWLELSKG